MVLLSRNLATFKTDISTLVSVLSCALHYKMLDAILTHTTCIQYMTKSSINIVETKGLDMTVGVE